MKHTVLLTGATGMIGRPAATRLLEEGHRVIGVSRGEGTIDHPGYIHVSCDLTRPEDVAALFDAHPCDRVVHLAALAHVTGETDLSYNRYFRENVLTSQHVFEQAAARHIPVFYASTVDVYGLNDGVITEASLPAPVGPYAETKREAEERLHALMGDTPFLTARFAPVYSPEDMHDILKRCYLKYPSVAYRVGKGADYAFLDVDRAVAAVAAWAERDPAPGGVIDLADPEPVNTREIVAAHGASQIICLPEFSRGLGLALARLLPGKLRLNVHKLLKPQRFDLTAGERFLSGGDPAPYVPAPPDLRGVRVLLLEGFARQNMALMPALKKLGCHLTTYNASRLDVGYASRYPDVKLVEYWNREDADASYAALIKVLQSGDYDVVIPMTDFSATLLSNHIEEVSQYAAPAVNPPEAFRRAADKQATMQTCAEAGVPCPHTLYDMTSPDQILEAGMPFPFIIKPRVGYGSIGFHVIRDEAQLRAVFDDTVKRFGPVVVQDYIPQTGTQYKCEVFLDQSGEARSAVVFDKTRWYPIDGGSTCCSASVHRPDIAADSIRLLKAMGWVGYGDVDLIEDPRDGVAKVMEVNPRITASVKVCFFAGVDFARQIVELYTGRPVTAYPDYRDGACLRYMHTDLLWFIQSPNRFRANPSWFSFRNTTDQIFSLRDPWPFVTYTIQAFKKRKKEMEKRKR